MPLTAGARLGPYEIIAPLGAGGMGEVYKARDPRLDRLVAIKILPPHASSDPDARARFEREARAVAALDHPHICAIYDFGRDPSTGSGQVVDFIVMQYLEGETFASRLQKGALTLDLVIRYGAEIAGALDKAHRAGIVHRDLKPGNVMLTKAGTKLLDFGLARLQPSPVATSGLSAVATEAPSLTAAGTILGTLQYMAPEQLEGGETDARTDIFALGTVLYEMATAKKAFTGKSQASVISAIMSAEPAPIATLQPMTPAALDHIVATCLAKDPEERWQSARDVERELRWITTVGAETSATPTVARKTPTLVTLSVAIVVAGAASAITWIASNRARTIQSAAVTRFSISLPPGKVLPGYQAAPVAISPDGRTIAYLIASAAGSHVSISAAAAGSQLYLRRLDQLSATQVAEANGSDKPSFSLDGQWVVFRSADGRIKKVSLSGGAAQIVAPSSSGGTGFAVGDDGSVVATPAGAGGALVRTPAGGGPEQPLLSPDRAKGEKGFRWPQVLPGSRAILMTVATGEISSYDDARIEVLDISSGNRRVVVQGGTYGRYIPTGHIVYARAGSLLAVPFDVQRLAPTGPPVSVLDGVATDPTDGNAAFAISPIGTLVYAPGGARRYSTSLVWVDRSGRAEPAADIQRPILYAALSPDEQRIAVTIEGANSGLWMYDLRRGGLTPLVARQFNNLQPVWSPDGKHLAFRSDRELGPQVLFRQTVDGAAPAERLTHENAQEAPGSWSPDGRDLLFARRDPKTGYDLWLLSTTDAKQRPFLQTPANENQGAISPDGRWVAYNSEQSGRSEVYVRSFRDASRAWPVSNDGGFRPLWARDGHELYFQSGGGDSVQVLAVDVKATAADFIAGKPRLLFTGPYAFGFDVARDGRFLMIKPEPEAFTQVNVVENWFEELKAKMGVK